MKVVQLMNRLQPRGISNFANLQMRSITVGTDMLSSVIKLQKAHPWYLNDKEGSNLAADNSVTTKELFENKTVAVFGVPAPFTGTCTNEHYPGYKALADDLKKAGVDEIICYAVADPYTHDAWAKSMGNDSSKITFMADADGSFAKAYGIDNNYDAVSLGDRCKRFSMIVSKGQVQTFREVTCDADKDAATLMKELVELKENAA